ncbi:MAG: thioredoxin domain-containing protein [Oligoflexia bacterium]
MPNRLAFEKSPYLRQHQDNPVDWYPWGEEAFETARKADKPILLSVGYSACHWCHVMAHESFENPQIAALMNEHFVNIKVDREEHPDVDQIYQQVTQLMTRSGGWPLTVFLTPELKPYFGGTYYPPEDRYGRPGFPRLLEALSRAYREQRGDVQENARSLLEAMQDQLPAAAAQVSRATLLGELSEASQRLLGIMDWEHGGLGRAPKFPNVMALSFLWRSGQAFENPAARQAVILSLVRMAEGGIYDQLGGGFHRYSVDERWAVPHFEKMLYDNALLLRLYSEVLLGAGAELKPEFRSLFLEVVSETVEYVLREMTTSLGAFYSAQDADSEGEEGKFFAWTPAEIEKVLSPDEARVFCLRYGVTSEGNFEHGTTVLHLARGLDAVAQESGLSVEEVKENLAFGCAKLREVRGARVAPGLDDKILVSWNGLMVTGLGWASKALGQAGRAKLAHRAWIAAHRALDWISEHAAGEADGSLYAVLASDGKPRIAGRLDDSAFLIRGAMDLLRFLPEEALSHRYPILISRVKLWAQGAWKQFADTQSSGFFMTQGSRSDLIQRPLSVHDQAIPSGAAVFLDCLLELRELGVELEVGERQLDSGQLEQRLMDHRPLAIKNPFGLSEMASVLLKYALGVVVIKGKKSQELQGHFAVVQESALGAPLQLCHQQTCIQASVQEIARRLGEKLVSRLHSPQP